MTRHIHLTKKANSIVAPPSKSFAQRILFCIALAKQSVIINNLGTNDDVLHILDIVKQLGFKVESAGEKTLLQKDGLPKNNEINIGESGLGTRLSVPILSLFFDDYTVTGTGTILNRSMQWFEDFLPQTGLQISLNKGYLPITASGIIKAGTYTVDGSMSSQYISGLLMTLPMCSDDSTLLVKNPTSIPYIDITLQVLEDFNVKIQNEGYERFSIPGNQIYDLDDLHYTVEGDWSSAAFWIVYGLLSQGSTLTNLNSNSVQADRAILEVVEKVGGKYRWENNVLHIARPEKLIPFEFDANHCPDLFPILAILAGGIEGKSTIKGTNRLIHKESDREAAILKEFSKFGLDMTTSNNSLAILGKGYLESAQIDPQNDHRIAMAAAVASVLTKDGVTIKNSNCVRKSFPNFWEITSIL